MSCGGVAGKCAARKSHLHIVAPVVTAVTVSLLGGRSLVFCLRLQWYLMIWPAMPLPHWVSGAVLAVNVLQKAKLLLWQHKFYTRQNYNLEFAPIRRNERSYRLLHLEIEFETDSYIHETKRALLQADIRLTKQQPEYHLWLDPLQAAADQSTPKHSKASNHPIQAASCICCICTNGIAGLMRRWRSLLQPDAHVMTSWHRG